MRVRVLATSARVFDVVYPPISDPLTLRYHQTTLQPDTSMGHPVGVETGAVKIYFRAAGVVMAMAERETFQVSKPLTGKKLKKLLPPEVSASRHDGEV